MAPKPAAKTEPKPTAKTESGWLLLAIGELGELYDRIARECILIGVRSKQIDVASLKSKAGDRPLVLVLTEATYRFDIAGFEEFALAVGARIVRLSDENAPEEELILQVRGTLLASIRTREAFQ